MGDWIAIDFALTAANLKFNMCFLLPYTKLWYTDNALPVSRISPSKTLTIVIAFVVFAYIIKVPSSVPMCGSPLSVSSRCATINNMNSSPSAPSGTRGPCREVWN